MSETQPEEEQKLDMSKFAGPLMGTVPGKTVTNICLQGYHENFAPRHTCKGGSWYYGKKWTCGCACHRYARGLPPDADFDPPRDPPRDPLKPTLSEELKAWAEANEVKRLGSVRPVHAVSADTISDSGRRARGALELQVYDVCNRYATGALQLYDEPFFTPPLISSEIAEVFGCAAPSTGAIGAVFDRWEEWELAYIGRKPIRFLMFAPVVEELGFTAARERMKARAKKQ